MRWKLKDPLAESFNPIPERTQQFPVIGEPQVLVNFKQTKKKIQKERQHQQITSMKLQNMDGEKGTSYINHIQVTQNNNCPVLPH